MARGLSASFHFSSGSVTCWSGNWKAEKQRQTTRHRCHNVWFVELTDADLIARVLVSDDQHAFGELVRRHQSAVRGLLRQLTRTDVALADDLAQEAFVRAYKNIKNFRGEAKFST